MGLNIHIPTFSELHADLRTSIGGKWKVSVVDTNRGNHEFFPLGDVWRPNLILNQGLDQVIDPPSVTAGYSLGSSIAQFVGGDVTRNKATAACGTSNTPPAASQTALSAQTQTTTTVNSASTSDDTINGSRTFTKAYDFAAVLSPVTLNEAGISSGEATQALFTRFLFPSPVSLLAGQFLRLTYALTVSIPSIVTPISVTLSSGTFIGDGDIKVIGTFDNIFGAMGSNGFVSSAPFGGRGFLLASKFYTSGGVVQTFARMGDNTTAFPSVNAGLTLVTVGSAPTITPASYTTGTFARSVQYIFAAGNPAVDTNVGGILFNTSASSATTYGPLWVFDAAQNKEALKSLVLNLTQSVTAP